MNVTQKSKSHIWEPYQRSGLVPEGRVALFSFFFFLFFAVFLLFFFWLQRWCCFPFFSFFCVKRSTLIVNCVLYHSTSPPSRVAATSYTIVEMQLPFLAPAVGPSSVSLLCKRRENGKSRETTFQVGYVAIAPVGNSSYASQTHKTGHSYDCYM